MLHLPSKDVRVVVDDTEIFTFTYKNITNSNSFHRLINTQEFIYKDGDLVIIYHSPKLINYITKTKKDKNLNNPTITLDIETRTIDNVIVPYCICYYNGKDSHSYYLSDFNSPDEMLSKCMSDLVCKENDGLVVYVHNLSKFDGVFLLKIKAKLNKTNEELIVSVNKREYAIGLII